MFRWAYGKREGPGRPMKPRFVGMPLTPVAFIPSPVRPPLLRGQPIFMTPDEFEAFRLIYYEGLRQEEAAERMGVSRGTVWRCLESARSKIAQMLVEQRPLVIMPAGPPFGGRQQNI